LAIWRALLLWKERQADGFDCEVNAGRASPSPRDALTENAAVEDVVAEVRMAVRRVFENFIVMYLCMKSWVCYQLIQVDEGIFVIELAR